MRIAALITGILGGIWSALLGMKWQGDANDNAAALEAAKQLGANVAEYESLMTASWFLVAGLGAGIVGGILVMTNKSKIGGGLMLLAAVAPALFTAKALVGTFLLLVAGVLSLLAKPKRSALS